MFLRPLVLGFAVLVSSAAAQTQNTLTLADGETGQSATIDDVAFITGHWQGDGLGGFNEEVWGEPLGGSMVGLFRHLQSHQPSFSEIMQIAEENGSLTLRLKHFNPDLTGWETQDEMETFPLVRVQPGEAAPSPLTPAATLPVIEAVRVGEMRLNDGIITYSDLRTGRSVEMSAINATLSLASLDDPLGVEPVPVQAGERSARPVVGEYAGQLVVADLVEE